MFYEKVWAHGAYSLVKRPDSPHYYITWCQPGTERYKRQSTRTDDLEAAKHELVEFVHRRSRGRRPEGPESISIQDALSDYVEHTLHGRPSQYKCRRWLDNWFVFLDNEGIRFIGDLTPDAQTRYIAWRKASAAEAGRTLSNATINREMDVVKGAISAYFERGFITRKPAIISLPKPPPRDRFLTVTEVNRLLNAVTAPHIRRFIVISLQTLQRPAAVLGLHANQVDLERNRIDFLPAGSIQTKKRRPIVPITSTLRPELERAIQESSTGFLIEFKGLPVSSIKTAFRKTVKRAGLVGVSPYTLRHTGATLLAGAGVSLWEIGGMLGHTHQRTTEIYAKHTPEYLAGAAKGLDDLFGAMMASESVCARRAPEPIYPQQWKTPQSEAA